MNKHFFKFIVCLTALILLPSSNGYAENPYPNEEKIIIINLLDSMYKVDTLKFQGHNILNDKNGPSVGIDNHCKLLQSYFDDEVIKKRVMRNIRFKTCLFPLFVNDIRYFGYEPFDDTGNFEKPKTMKPSISIPSIKDNEATTTVRVKIQKNDKYIVLRADYFLRKKTQGWRIYKVYYGEDSKLYFGGDEKPEEKLTFPPEPWESEFH